MIEKLQPYNGNRVSMDGVHWEIRPNMEDVVNKVNEIIDAVNANSLGFSMPQTYSRFPFLGVDPGDTKKSEPVKHGRWISHGSYFTCSVCGEEQYGVDTGRYYCQNCGAKMEKE